MLYNEIGDFMVDLEVLKERIGMDEKVIGRERYFNSAVMALVVENGGKYHLLFQKRAKNIRQGGEISFPGGKIDEKDRNSLEAAFRECFEEIGIPRERIELIGKIGTHITPSSTMVEAYLGKTTIEDMENLELNESEVERCFLVPLEFFIKTAPRIEKLQVETQPFYEENGKIYQFPYEEFNLPDRYRKPWKSPPKEVYFYSYGEELIWGITAEIIVEIIKYIKR